MKGNALVPCIRMGNPFDKYMYSLSFVINQQYFGSTESCRYFSTGSPKKLCESIIQHIALLETFVR